MLKERQNERRLHLNHNLLRALGIPVWGMRYADGAAGGSAGAPAPDGNGGVGGTGGTGGSGGAAGDDQFIRIPRSVATKYVPDGDPDKFVHLAKRGQELEGQYRTLEDGKWVDLAKKYPDMTGEALGNWIEGANQTISNPTVAALMTPVENRTDDQWALIEKAAKREAKKVEAAAENKGQHLSEAQIDALVQKRLDAKLGEFESKTAQQRQQEQARNTFQSALSDQNAAVAEVLKDAAGNAKKFDIDGEQIERNENAYALESLLLREADRLRARDVTRELGPRNGQNAAQWDQMFNQPFSKADVTRARAATQAVYPQLFRPAANGAAGAIHKPPAGALYGGAQGGKVDKPVDQMSPVEYQEYIKARHRARQGSGQT